MFMYEMLTMPALSVGSVAHFIVEKISDVCLGLDSHTLLVLFIFCLCAMVIVWLETAPKYLVIYILAMV